MKNAFLPDAKRYQRAHRRRRLWHRIVTALAAAVVFCTTYALILPAITLENNCICGQDEHQHGADCFQAVQTEQFSTVLVCAPEGHSHTADCFDAEGHLICGLADVVLHRHDEYCFDEAGQLICTLPAVVEHIHGEDCWQETQELICGQEETWHEHGAGCTAVTRGACICGQEEGEAHQHTTECYEQLEELICQRPEDPAGHRHTDVCRQTAWTLTCTQEQIAEHEHTPDCCDESGALVCGILSAQTHRHTEACRQQVSGGFAEEATLVCGLPEHTHTEACLPAGDEAEPPEDTPEQTDEAEPVSGAVQYVIDRIAALPTAEEVAAILTAYEESGYQEGYEAYYSAMAQEARTTYGYYEELMPEEQELVANREKLLELEWLWGAETLEITDTLTVYQVNSYSQAKTTLVYGGSVQEKLGAGMRFLDWNVAVVKKNDSGQFYVADHISDNSNKLSQTAPENGFLLLVYRIEVKTNFNIGDIVSINFDYKKVSGYTASGHGVVTTASGGVFKNDKDNSSKLTTVQGADTNELIEVNLYDYGTNINDLYNGNHNYPGFQQDGGSKGVGASFNFGNNITEDLAAGKSNLTNKGGAINTTEDGANSPISDVMQTTLGADGYPALANSTSLGYLFSNSTYASKKNRDSINGLFLYHEDTGAYTFNSRENHAQFNEGSDTFTLYKQIISSNFMMYPFGNFLPFNDIVHQSAQSSTIDKAYLQSIADSARYKYQNGAGDEYNILSTQLGKFIGLMDGEYPSGWTAANCADEYFEAAGIGKTFTDAELKDIYTIDYDEATDFYFGMEMKMNFMQPKGGLTGNDGEQPMVFYFTGDDDVWVYVDGVLFLDLSGIHRHVGGEIDFVNGLVKYYSLDVATGDVSTTPYKTVRFSELVDSSKLNEKGTFQDYTTHSFNFYYMERGAGSGVCRMNFNFPLLRKNSISVTKELSVDGESKLPLLGDPNFRFQVLKEDGETPFIGAGTSYDILDTKGSRIGTGTTDENGVFTLKAGQTAVFSGIQENAGRYFVRELLNTDVFGQYGSVSVNGSSTTQDSYTHVTVGSDTFHGVDSPVKDVSEGSTVFRFDNNVTTSKLGGLTITKTVTDYEKARITGQFQFRVTLDGAPLPAGTAYQVGSETRYAAEGGLITLAPGETAVIANILAGTRFTVTETEASSAGYVVSYIVGDVTTSDQASGVIGVESTVAVTVNNAETGASVEIPVQKTLLTPDGREHTYTFTLTQVKGKNDLTPVDGFEPQTLEITVAPDTGAGSFQLDYPLVDLGSLPKTFCYRINEVIPEESAGTIYDQSVYVAEVTVSEAGSGELQAIVTGIWKAGSEDAVAAVTFTNQIQRYELPQTGGSGVQLCYIAGAALLAAAYLLYRSSKRGKGACSNH